jgi:hypothetical protein
VLSAYTEDQGSFPWLHGYCGAKNPNRSWDFFTGHQHHYFLWHFEQLAGVFVAKAFFPLWHSPQYLPALISDIFSSSVLFFIGKIFGWQSLHFRPFSAWMVPLNVTLPTDPSLNSRVFPEGTAKTSLLMNANANTNTGIKNDAFSFIPFLLSAFGFSG